MTKADEVLEYTVTEEEEGRRLDQVLAEHFEVSRSQLERHLAAGAVTINDAAPSRGKRTRLQAGMRLRYTPPPVEPLDLEPEAMELEILFEDDHLLVVDKPAHVVVHPGEGHARGTLLAGVLHHVGQLPSTDPIRPGVVHRLDRGTTGVIAFAKTVEAHAGLVDAFKAREVEKTYLAVTQGVPKPTEGTYDTFFGRHPQHRQRFSSRVPEGKRAITHYQLLEVYPGAASVQVELETGRTHQIRVHFADAGHPLVGDDAYSRRRSIRDPATREVCASLDRPALHAWILSLRHPITGRDLSWTAPMPDDLVTLVEGLRGVAALREKI
ncbi:MAG: RluA family pseudouridine synthase [Myxococcota bacterium]